MKTTVNFYHFERAFHDAGRAKQFSRGALRAIFDWHEEYERASGEEVELDVIALCCEWSEYECALDAAIEYGYTPDANMSAEEQEEYALEWLNDRTQVQPFDGGIVMVQF